MQWEKRPLTGAQGLDGASGAELHKDKPLENPGAIFHQTKEAGD